MSVMLGELYKALVNPSDEQALKAAQEVAGYENRLNSLDTKVTVLTWMVGVLITLSLVTLGLDFQILMRLPR